MRAPIADERGTAAIEFALVGPTFLMMLFLLFDGGRMLFQKQALNELANAVARCAALKATGCTTKADAESWATSRGLTRSRLVISAATVTMSGACNGQSGSMARATVSAAFPKGAMTLLPQSAAPSTLTSTSCFPVAS